MLTVSDNNRQTKPDLHKLEEIHKDKIQTYVVKAFSYNAMFYQNSVIGCCNWCLRFYKEKFLLIFLPVSVCKTTA